MVLLDTLVSAEVTGVAAKRAAVEFEDAGDDVVQKVAVMGDKHHGTAKIAQQRLQPGDGVQVEVVRGLVEQQHIRNRNERLRQRHALLHAAAEFAHVTAPVKLQMRQRRVDALLPVPGVQRFDARVKCIEGLIVSRGMRDVCSRMVFVGGAHRAGFGHTFAHGVKHGDVGFEDRFLGDITNAQTLRQLQQTVVQLLQPRNNFQER